MGRVKLEIKKIKEKDRRAMTYQNRRKGILKAAYELSVLCDVDIGVIVNRSSSELEFFGKRDRLEKFVAGNLANISKVEDMKVKFGNMESIRIFRKSSDERDLKVPWVGHAEFHVEKEELKASHHLAAEKNLEKNVYEDTARSDNECVDSYGPSPDSANVKGDPKQGFKKVRKCTRQLQEAVGQLEQGC